MIALEDVVDAHVPRKTAAKVRAVEALIDVATTLGRTPTTTDYTAQYDTQRRRGDLSLPSVSMVVRAFGGWNTALAASGLVDPARPDELKRRKARVRFRVARYPDERLIESLQACARAYGHVPTVLDYQAWRGGVLNIQAVSHLRERDIPHWRTIYKRFGTWTTALERAGLSRESKRQAPSDGWSELA
jgi:hypothetical protein